MTNSTPRPDLGPNISTATFQTTHTYSNDGSFTITYIEHDRSSGVLNIQNSDDVPYVTFVKINTNDANGCNQFPVLTVIPVDRACSQVAFLHNSGAYDPDGDSLSYELSIPASSETTFAVYTPPNDQKFYTDFSHGNENHDAPPSFAIDAVTGLLTWDAPGLIGEYNIAFRVIEWRKQADGSYIQLSATTRDMQIVVEECHNTRPDLMVPSDTCVVAGTVIDKTFFGFDVEHDPVKIELFSEILSLEESPASYSPVMTEFVPSDPAAEISFHWQTSCHHTRQQPYQVVLKITDDPADGPKLVTYKTWSIRITASPPQFVSAQLNVINDTGMLKWDSYTCDNAVGIQVWRKVGSVEFTPGICQIGLPGFLGYQLIATLPSNVTEFTDDNFGMRLDPAATYCYRLVAVVGDTKGIVSDELCIGPVRADAPVITHVSVEETAELGKIRVSWRSPFDIDKAQFPPPYRYEVFRARGFIGDASITSLGVVGDTTFLDEGVNARDEIFNYRIVLYSKPSYSPDYIAVDTSAVASSVRLDALPILDGIALHWRDSVPWSNVSAERPYHLIYRGTLNPDQPMVLYDSIVVNENGFHYIDQAVQSDQLYSYKVLTRGTYGNPLISVLENFSQVIFQYPLNTLTPCPPMVSINQNDCTQSPLGCQQVSFENSISWVNTFSDHCRLDVAYYKVYVRSGTKGEFDSLVTTAETSYKEVGLTSMARCYKVSTVDSRGIESELSEMVCNDNCPYFELPNVFTPNGDGCNDVFSARFDDELLGGPQCGIVDHNKCPRFVKAVDAKIYNRWGREIFTSRSSAGQSLFIDWPGKDNNGNDCATGIYYYTADVTFDVLQSSTRTYKGWVHLVR